MRTPVLAIVTLLAVSVPAFAQRAPAFDVSTGYSVLKDGDLEDEIFHGWVASATGHVNQWFGIKGEVGGHYKSIDLSPLFDVPGRMDLSVLSFMAGPTFTSRPAGRVTAFGHVLAGAAQGRASFAGESETETALAVQPGGGVDIALTRNVGVCVGADFRRIFSDDPGNERRVHVGMVISGGSR